MEDSIVHDNYRMDFSSGRILIKQLRRFLIAFILFSLLVSCQREYPISGHIEGINETWRNHVYLIDPLNFDGLATSYLGKVVDSAEITKDGFFAFEKLPMHRTADLMEICVQKQTENHLNGLENDQIGASNYFPLVVKEGTALLVQAKAADFQKSFQIRDPSPENNSMLALRDIRQDAADKWLASASNESHNPEALLDQEKALLNYQKSLMAFAEKTAFATTAMTAIRWISPEANYERIPEFLFAQCEKWKVKEPENIFVRHLCQYAQRDKLPVMIGDQIPDFLLPMLSGDTVSLSSLLSGKLNIIDLWASWCIPCRHENRDFLVPIWDQNHSAGLQVVGYALDASDKVWRAAILKDGADRWLNASHLNGDDSPFFESLRISTIPANFLVDHHGVVVAKNLHGKDLASYVEEYLRSH